MRQWRLRLGTVTCAAMLSAVSMPLAAESKTVNMTLTIVVNAAPPCTVTGGEVEFGNVLTTKVDGVNYRQAVGYRLSCNGRVSDYLKLQIQGNAVTINGESVLQTDVDGLGIRLQTATDGARWFHPAIRNGCHFNTAVAAVRPSRRFLSKIMA